MIRAWDLPRISERRLIVLLASFVASMDCVAQSPPTPASATRDCQLAGQVLQTGHPANKREWAEGYVMLCPGEGPAFVASRWNAPPRDTAGLNDLAFTSASFRDRRLYDRLRAVAQDRGAADAVRVSAMMALARLTDRHFVVQLVELRYREYRTGYVPLIQNTQIHAAQDDGAQLLGNVNQEVLTLLQQIAANRESEPRAVWWGAAVLARRVASSVDR